jgi:4-hydroxy-3-methylbut-2-en-1-yl diphosphate synthase IspG/GcpE
MGCAVNGPGEAGEADAGVFGGRAGRGRLVAKGEKPVDMPAENLARALADKVRALAEAWGAGRPEAGT